MDKSTDNQNKNNENVDNAADTGSQASIETAPDSDNTNLKRRRALLAGLAAVPVILTLKSRSAFSQAQPECSIVLSVNLNGATSQHPNVQIGNDDLNRCGIHNP